MPYVFSKKSKYIAITVLTLLVIILIVVCVAAIIVPISIWLGIGSYAYSEIYLAGKSRNACIDGNLFSNDFKPFSDCDCIPKNVTIDFQRYSISNDKIVEIEFEPRSDSKWEKAKLGNLKGWLISYDNFTVAPTVVVVHGIRVCRKVCTSMTTYGMLHSAGYNVIAMDLRNHGQSPDESPPYATFGSTEYRDVLGAVDYLEHIFGPNVTNNLGLVGHSMGGSTAILAYANEPRLKALFLDSAACDVYNTLVKNVNSATKSNLAKSILNAGCMLKKTYGCAPFDNDPMTAIATLVQRPVHFDHCKTDTLVPVGSTYTCSKIMLERSENKDYVTTYVAESGYRRVSSDCHDHIYLMHTQSSLYEARLKSFLDKYLR
jgi:pimeloyl-ACP methyl ester carboxylesterase